MFDFSDDTKPFVFTDASQTPIPDIQVIGTRAAKIDYALGVNSPGEQNITQTIGDGSEETLRRQSAANFDAQKDNARTLLATKLAQTQGGAVTPEQAAVVTKPYNPSDPNSILEKIYAGRFVSDVVNTSPELANDPALRTSLPDAKAIAADIKLRHEWEQTQLENLSTKWAKTGVLESIPSYISQLIPILPWWRQAQAVDRPSHMNFLMGKTIADNIAYLHSLPFPEMQAKYKQAIDYLETSGNTLDALTFAQAMVSYTTSDEFLASSISVADYATIGAPVLKIAGRLVKGAKAAKVAETVPSSMDHAIEELARDTPATAVESPVWKQLDLFGEQPEQGSFRFMNSAEQTAPLLESKFPPGKMRATHTTDFTNYGDYELATGTRQVPGTGLFRDSLGRIQRSSNAFKQKELPLGSQEHQLSLDLARAAPKGQTEKYTEAIAEKSVQVKRGLAEAIKATAGAAQPDPEAVIGAFGNIKEAGLLGALKRVLNPSGQGNVDFLREIPTFAAPTDFLSDSRVISRAHRQLLQPKLEKSINDLLMKLAPTGEGGIARVSRLTQEQLDLANKIAEAELRKEYGKRVGDGFINISRTPAELHPANLDTVHFNLGQPDATLFPSVEKADMARADIYGLGASEARVVPQGSGYMLQISKHVDETHPDVQSLVHNPANATSSSMVNSLVGRLRSSADILGKFQRENRYIATHAPQEIRKIIRDFIKDNIETLGKTKRQRLNDILRENRDMPSKTNPAERGRWYDTAGEFEEAYHTRFKEMPSEAEIVAYDQFKRLSDFDWITRNLAVYRDKARGGYEQFRFSFTNAQSPWFEGKQMDAMPWSLGKADQDAGIWVYNSQTGKGTFHYKFNINPETKAEIDDLTANKGYRVVQIFEPRKHPLEGIAKTKAGENLQEQVNYVITNTWEKSPLSWKQVDYRPGGHVIYPHQWYIVSPDIREGRSGKLTYFGDHNILNVKTAAQAKKFAERLDYARQLFRDGKTDELHDYIDKSLPHSRDQFYDLFRRSDSPLNPNVPVVFKEAGYNSLETSTHVRNAAGGNLIDATKNIHDPSNFMDKAYLMDRDNILSTVLENDRGLSLGHAEQLDPYIALNRAIGQGLRNLWMNDYKIGAIENWIKEFGPAGSGVLKPNDATLVHHPLYFLYHPQYADISSLNRAEYTAAETARKSIVDFVGTRTELGKTMEAFKTRLIDTVYKTQGDGWWLDTAINTTSNPVNFLRGIAFHSKLGIFNPVQLFVQAQSMAHSIAVAGVKNGGAGFAAAPLIRWLGHNPAMLDTVAGVAEKVGWTRSSFKEMYETLQKTGLYQVAGEAALRNDAFDPHLFRSTFGYFLDAGTMFFNEGERMTRMTAWATAFREWRAVNPSIKIGNREIGQILRRAEDLSVNMTRADNAAWQTGVWSVPTQFFAYNARVMEQLLGKRLTLAEKARMMTVYSAMYGLPIGIGASVGGVFPMYDSIKEAAFKRGINLNEGWMKVATEGLIATAVSGVTGHDYNIAQRYGPGNNQAIVDALRGDKSFMDIVFGASGTIAAQIGQTFINPFYYKTASITQGTEYPLKASDWISLFRNVATIDVATKSLMALSYGKWLTRTGTQVSDADGMDAAMAWLGLTPRAASDAFLWQQANRDVSQSVNKIGQLASEQFRIGLQKAQEGDRQGYHDYMARVQVIIQSGDLNYSQQRALYSKMITQNRTLAEKVKWDALHRAPNRLYDDFLKNFIRK